MRAAITRPVEERAARPAAVQEIENMSGIQLDPKIVSEFLAVPVSEWKTTRQEIAAKTKRADFLRFSRAAE